MDHLQKSSPALPTALRAGYPIENEDDILVRAGLKLNHFRLISAIADHGQVSLAAEMLSISQPAASRMLREVESILKTPLFERGAKGMIATRFGEAMAKRARTVLLEIREANRELAELKTGHGGSVSIGSVTAPAVGLAVPAIRKVRSLYPAIRINFHVDTSNVLARDLLSARYDFIIGRIPDDLDPRLFNAIPLGIEKACLIVRQDHPLAARQPCSLAEVATYDWVFQPQGALLSRRLELMFMEHGIVPPKNIVTTSSVLLTMALIADSEAIAPIAEDVANFLAGHSGEMGKITVLETDFDIMLQPFSLITVNGRALPPTARRLHDLVLDECARSQVQSRQPR